MKAVHLTEWCAEGTVPEAVAFGDVPAPPAPVKRQVAIEIKASAINIDDIAACQDTAGGGRCFHVSTPRPDAPLIGGCEYGGVVVACGPDVTQFRVGDRVCGVQDMAVQKNPGTWAERTLAPESDVCPLPADMTFVSGAALAMAGLVSGDMYRRASARLESGARCLVLGASGGLGTVMLQLLHAHASDLHVVAVCSGRNAEMVRRLGADEVVDYTSAPFKDQLRDAASFDVVFDFVGGSETQRDATPLLRRRGQFITAVGPWQNLGDRKLSWCEWTGWCCGLSGRLLKGYCCPCSGFQYRMAGGMPPVSPHSQRSVVSLVVWHGGGQSGWPQVKAEDFNALVGAGARAEIALEVPFAEQPVREALRRVASRHTSGKVVINMERAE